MKSENHILLHLAFLVDLSLAEMSNVQRWCQEAVVKYLCGSSRRRLYTQKN